MYISWVMRYIVQIITLLNLTNWRFIINYTWTEKSELVTVRFIKYYPAMGNTACLLPGTVWSELGARSKELGAPACIIQVFPQYGQLSLLPEVLRIDKEHDLRSLTATCRGNKIIKIFLPTVTFSSTKVCVRTKRKNYQHLSVTCHVSMWSVTCHVSV